MRVAWTILLISALTDFIITMATGLTAAMLTTGTAMMPSKATWLVCMLGGAMQAARTIQGALKSTPETAAALKGDVSRVETTTVVKTP